jgi:hypothetical protein
MMMADVDDPYNLFALNMMFNADNKEYRFDWMSGGFAGLIILKIIMMFQYTTQFGPILKMIITMSKQMAMFTIVWLFIIILFVCVGQLVFYELADFKNLTTSFTYLIQGALGAWDINVFLLPRKYSCEDGDITNCYYKPRPFYDQYIGLVFMLIYLILNLVIIINLVVAILATTYNEYSEFQRGLYYDTLIQELPNNLYHKHYGCMVVAPSILSGVMLLLSPVLWALRCAPKLLK